MNGIGEISEIKPVSENNEVVGFNCVFISDFDVDVERKKAEEMGQKVIDQIRGQFETITMYESGRATIKFDTGAMDRLKDDKIGKTIKLKENVEYDLFSITNIIQDNTDIDVYIGKTYVDHYGMPIVFFKIKSSLWVIDTLDALSTGEFKVTTRFDNVDNLKVNQFIADENYNYHIVETHSEGTNSKETYWIYRENNTLCVKKVTDNKAEEMDPKVIDQIRGQFETITMYESGRATIKFDTGAMDRLGDDRTLPPKIKENVEYDLFSITNIIQDNTVDVNTDVDVYIGQTYEDHYGMPIVFFKIKSSLWVIDTLDALNTGEFNVRTRFDDVDSFKVNQYSSVGCRYNIVETHSKETYWIYRGFRMLCVNKDTDSVFKELKPSGFAGASLIQVRQYINGDVYVVTYSGENSTDIVSKELVAKDARLIETSYDSETYGAIVISGGEKVKDTYGWIIFK